MTSSATTAGEPPLSPAAARRLRDALAAFPTGVVIATAWDRDAGPLGMTMNSFTSISLHPALILFSIDRRAASLPAWRRAAGYAINVLAGGQESLSNQFARAFAAKWAGVRFVRGLHGAPLLDGALARFECTAHQQLDGGDHVIFLGRVEQFAADDTAGPLVFHRGRYRTLAFESGSCGRHRCGGDLEPAGGWPLSIHY